MVKCFLGNMLRRCSHQGFAIMWGYSKILVNYKIKLMLVHEKNTSIILKQVFWQFYFLICCYWIITIRFVKVFLISTSIFTTYSYPYYTSHWLYLLFFIQYYFRINKNCWFRINRLQNNVKWKNIYYLWTNSLHLNKNWAIMR